MARSIHHSDAAEGEPELSDHVEDEGEETEQEEEERDLLPVDFFDTDAVFPFADIPFFVPRAIDDPLVKNLLKKRIHAAGGRIVASVLEAKVIVVPFNPSVEFKKVVGKHEGIRDGSVAAVLPDWVLRVYYKGYASIPEGPGPLVRNDTLSRIAVADLGDEALRLDVMLALECNGAIVVPFAEADWCVVPAGHPFLERVPTRYEGKRFLSPECVFDACKIAREPPPTQKRPAARKGAQRTSLSGRRIRPPRRRNPFTAEDRHNLARFLAWECPGGGGRKSRRVYEDLVANDPDDPVLGWAAEHPAEGWRQHYRDNHDSRWDDGTVLDDLIEDYIDDGIDESLTTAAERQAARRQQRASSQRDVGQRASETLGSPANKKRGRVGHLPPSPQQSVKRRSSGKPARAGRDTSSQEERYYSPDALEVAAEVGAALGE